jgi:hypothetical protein
MPNRNHNDKARANFNARHNCDSKHDKSKAGYWACKVSLHLPNADTMHFMYTHFAVLFPGLEKGPQELSVHESASGVRGEKYST